MLSSIEDFSSAKNDYDLLSNVCHHNGSGHRLFHRGLRKTLQVVPPKGPAIHMRTPDNAVTIEYPSEKATRAATNQTAGLAYHCAKRVSELLDNLPLARGRMHSRSRRDGLPTRSNIKQSDGRTIGIALWRTTRRKSAATIPVSAGRGKSSRLAACHSSSECGN
jgi:hypothetical protein